MIASLPMYQRPENAAAHDRFWTLICDALPHGAPRPPDRLTRDGDIWDHWRDPDLFLSQTCGMPYRTRLHGHVNLLGTPDFGLPGLPAGHYNSVFVCRADDPRPDLEDFSDALFAVNDGLSQSGWAAPQHHMTRAGLPMFGHVILSGGHGNSARAVARGKADIAALDAVSWRMIRRFDALACELREIGETRPTPGLPYITAFGPDTDDISAALEHAIADLDGADRDLLGGLGGYRVFSPDDYLALPPAPPLPTP